MVWGLFSRKKKTAAKVNRQARNIVTVPTGTPEAGVSGSPPDTQSSLFSQGKDPISFDKSQIDALTIMAAIESAKQELASHNTHFPGKAQGRMHTEKASSSGTSDQAAARKKQLIQAAMAVHKYKQSALQDLEPDDRNRLRSMAEEALGLAPPPDTRS
jgi:CCR4-NOT transcriptional regulation complex NOT5 subunit